MKRKAPRKHKHGTARVFAFARRFTFLAAGCAGRRRARLGGLCGPCVQTVVFFVFFVGFGAFDHFVFSWLPFVISIRATAQRSWRRGDRIATRADTLKHPASILHDHDKFQDHDKTEGEIHVDFPPFQAQSPGNFRGSGAGRFHRRSWRHLALNRGEAVGACVSTVGEGS